MPKNLGLYDDDLSTPRKKDVDNCYSPNNVPPYPVTSVNDKTGDVTLGASDVGAVNKAGDTMTGNLTVGSASMQTNGYVTGTWLKTTANIALNKTPTKIAVLDDGWVYSRTPEQIKSDIGLSNVENVKQYSSTNPPPYPVTSVSGKTGAVTLTKANVGLNNVDNVKQYSANNPPPYPVTSVNGQQGDVTVVKIVVSKEIPNNMNDGDLWYQILS